MKAKVIHFSHNDKKYQKQLPENFVANDNLIFHNNKKFNVNSVLLYLKLLQMNDGWKIKEIKELENMTVDEYDDVLHVAYEIGNTNTFRYLFYHILRKITIEDVCKMKIIKVEPAYNIVVNVYPSPLWVDIYREFFKGTKTKMFNLNLNIKYDYKQRESFTHMFTIVNLADVLISQHQINHESLIMIKYLYTPLPIIRFLLHLLLKRSLSPVILKQFNLSSLNFLTNKLYSHDYLQEQSHHTIIHERDPNKTNYFYTNQQMLTWLYDRYWFDSKDDYKIFGSGVEISEVWEDHFNDETIDSLAEVRKECINGKFMEPFEYIHEWLIIGSIQIDKSWKMGLYLLHQSDRWISQHGIHRAITIFSKLNLMHQLEILMDRSYKFKLPYYDADILISQFQSLQPSFQLMLLTHFFDYYYVLKVEYQISKITNVEFRTRLSLNSKLTGRSYFSELIDNIHKHHYWNEIIFLLDERIITIEDWNAISPRILYAMTWDIPHENEIGITESYYDTTDDNNTKIVEMLFERNRIKEHKKQNFIQQIKIKKLLRYLNHPYVHSNVWSVVEEILHNPHWLPVVETLFSKAVNKSYKQKFVDFMSIRTIIDAQF